MSWSPMQASPSPSNWIGSGCPPDDDFSLPSSALLVVHEEEDEEDRKDDSMPMHMGMQGWSHHHGPPSLRLNKSANLLNMKAMDPDHPAVINATDIEEAETVVTVDWGTSDIGLDLNTVATLSIYRLGSNRVLTVVSANTGAPLVARFMAEPPGAWFMAELLVAQVYKLFFNVD